MSLNIVMIFQSVRLVICIHPSSAHQAIPHEAFTKNGIVHPNRSIASFLTMACVWTVNVLAKVRCLGMVFDESRPSKSTSDAPSKPRDEAVPFS